jgi:hypothetical protein
MLKIRDIIKIYSGREISLNEPIPLGLIKRVVKFRLKPVLQFPVAQTLVCSGKINLALINKNRGSYEQS